MVVRMVDRMRHATHERERESLPSVQNRMRGLFKTSFVMQLFVLYCSKENQLSPLDCFAVWATIALSQ